MKEHSIKSVRLTPTVKARLDTFKGSDTVSVCVDRMITFFEITGFNPRYASKNPTALVEKRIEDLIKIIKSQERDIFKPILEKLAGICRKGTGSSSNSWRSTGRTPRRMWKKNGRSSAGWQN